MENHVRKHGPEIGPVLYHLLQSQAAHAGVSARLRRKIELQSGKAPAARPSAALPLFPVGAEEPGDAALGVGA